MMAKACYESFSSLPGLQENGQYHYTPLLNNLEDINPDLLSKLCHYVNVTVHLQFSQKTRVFTLIIVTSP